jgi:hypothetical protein
MIIDYYPEILREKVNIISSSEIFINLNKKHSGWITQQLTKILICKHIKAKYYLIMDSKNHFIRKNDYNDYFSEDNKPKLFTSYLGKIEGIRERFFNCLHYFDIDGEIYIKKNRLFITTTPFMFITKDVLDMINYITTKENMSFIDFFLRKPYEYTEFYLYSSYLHFSNKLENYHICDVKDTICITIMSNPNIFWNTYEMTAVKALNNVNIKVFGLHRLAITNMDLEYKKKIIYFYKQMYDDIICNFIQDELLSD